MNALGAHGTFYHGGWGGTWYGGNGDTATVRMTSTHWGAVHVLEDLGLLEDGEFAQAKFQIKLQMALQDTIG